MDARQWSFFSGLALLLGGIGGVVASGLIPGAQVALPAAVSSLVAGIGVLAASNSGPGTPPTGGANGAASSK